MALYYLLMADSLLIAACNLEGIPMKKLAILGECMIELNGEPFGRCTKPMVGIRSTPLPIWLG